MEIPVKLDITWCPFLFLSFFLLDWPLGQSFTYFTTIVIFNFVCLLNLVFV